MKRNSLTIAVDEFRHEETEKYVSIPRDKLDFPGSEGLNVHAPAELRMKLLKFGRDFNVRGGLTTRLGFECSRCLEHFEVEIDVTFNNIYTQMQTISDLDFELEHVDLETSIIEGDHIDLRDLVYEQLVLQVPIKPLCRDDCKGLCPECGQDLNQKECGCFKDIGDPRFAVLKNLIGRENPSD